MGYIADLVEKVVNVNYGCPECGHKPPKNANPKSYFERKDVNGNKYTLKCRECNNTFAAYICYKCGRGYATRGDFSIFQRSNSSSVVAYDCKCGNNLYVDQDRHLY